MTLKVDELLLLKEEFKTRFPYLVTKSPPPTPLPTYPTFTTTEIDKTIEEQLKNIPTGCKKWKEILFNLVKHFLIVADEDKKSYMGGDNSEEKDLKSVKVMGDIDVDFATNKKGNDFDSYWNSTKYGSRARKLLIDCAKSRIGLIRC